MLKEIIIGLGGTIAGAAIGYTIRNMMGKYNAKTIEKKAELILEQAKHNAETLLKESEVQAKTEVVKAREEFEKTTESRKKELSAREKRIEEREIILERKVTMIEKKEAMINERMAQIEKENAKIAAMRKELEALVSEERTKLQRISGMSREQARTALLNIVENELKPDIAMLIHHKQEQAKSTSEVEAQRIIANAIQRYSASHASELMTTTINLGNNEMKGRIIGRDGRNIRSFEAITGVNVIVDDTPDTVVLSSFDPIRREVARQALEALVADGRIHPARIEEVVNKVQESMEETIRNIGEKAAFDCGVTGINPEIIRMLGRLHFRSSYAQNVLQHSIEVSHLMGVMSAELDLDPVLARRIGLFHDIGKALSHEVEGGHAVIGADLLKRYGESQVVINAVAAHHEEVPSESVYSLLASAADTISSSRLGARDESIEMYLKRLEKLESIANSFKGVKKSYAIQAGREVRVIVEPVQVDDNEALIMARDIAKKIEKDLQYPGQIRIVVIRETRCVEYAR